MKYSKREKKEIEKRREEILKTLPNFLNQLLLLSESGLVLGEAFKKISLSYENLPEESKNYFTESIVDILKESNETNENVVILFHRFSRLSGVKELTRLGNTLIENKSKGLDLWDKLEAQNESLWETKKRKVMESIKIKESKMSFPLGILLVSLIIITAAPSFLQMG